MPRPRKQDVQDYIEQEHTDTPEKFNVKNLIPLVWRNDLEAMKEAVANIQGDEGTMRAVENLLKSNNCGIASQFLQQIIQRNS